MLFRWTAFTLLLAIIGLVACDKTQDVTPTSPAAEPTASISQESQSPSQEPQDTEYWFMTYAGAYSDKSEAEAVAEKLQRHGYTTEVVECEQDYLVRIAKADNDVSALDLKQQLIDAGFTNAFCTRSKQDEPAPAENPTATNAEARAAVDDAMDLETHSETPFSEQREILPLTDVAKADNPILLPEDTQARDPQLWAEQLDDPGCLLMTERESHGLLQTNAEKRRQFRQELSDIQGRQARRPFTVYLGSYRDREQAELAAMQAGKHGLALSVQQDNYGGWIVVAPACDTEAAATALEHQLAAIGLDNTARLSPSAVLRQQIRDLKTELWRLDEQDEIARACLQQFQY
ncbi:SPOR domain-containing protein [bacterium]|nr:SPOR domain-containing protein [bacterium]